MVSRGGADNNQEAERMVRFIGVFATPLVAIYAMATALGVIPHQYSMGDVLATTILASLWVILSLYFFIKEPSSRLNVALRLIALHTATIALLIVVIGFWQPFIALYALLFVATYLYFGKKGTAVSMLSLGIAGALDILIRLPVEPAAVVLAGIPVIATIFLGVSILAILNAQDSKQLALKHSQARERLQYDRINTIMNNLTDAAFSTDENGKILMYNAASLDLIDTNDSLKGKYIGEVFKLTNTDSESVNLYEILKDTTRATRRDDLSHTYSDGESIRLEITFAPIKSSYSVSKKRQEMGGYILILRDVTKQKSLEEERDEFISVVSHELRTPITIVEGTLSNLDVLMKRPELPDSKLLGTNITTAHDQVLYLARMVNDLSTLSRAERGVADAPEAIDVTDLMTTLFQKYEKEAKLRGLQLNIDLGTKLGTVNVSRLYLEELLQNFVTNAIKYTNEGSVTIIAKRVKDTVTLGVKDTGIGIGRGDQNKVFNKFYRSEDYRIRETNGTGLGLYVSTKLARKLRTQIDLKSRLNHGSTFSFELPVE
jgi:two-component system, OmpR family, phosphate regulon sensor histidine kinase PhoR